MDPSPPSRRDPQELERPAEPHGQPRDPQGSWSVGGPGQHRPIGVLDAHGQDSATMEPQGHGDSGEHTTGMARARQPQGAEEPLGLDAMLGGLAQATMAHGH